MQRGFLRASSYRAFLFLVLGWSALATLGCEQIETTLGVGSGSLSDAGSADSPQYVAACDASSSPLARESEPPSPASSAVPVGSVGTRLAVMTWNLQWFQDPKEGPTDDVVQYAAVREILASSDMSLVALQEVASEQSFERILHDLPRYAGVLSGYAWTQKTALLWQAAFFELAGARAISGLDDAGRPPLELRLRKRGDQRELLVVVVHAKAQADSASHDRRVRLVHGLKAHLDAEHGETPTIVLGDFNDLLDGSITAGADTPYRPFLDDPRYAAPTRIFNSSRVKEASFMSGATIDHILLSKQLAAGVEPESVDVLRDELLMRYPHYTATVSDHFPVTLAIAW